MSESLGSAVLELNTIDKGLIDGLNKAENLTKASMSAMSRAVEGVTSSIEKMVGGLGSIGGATDSGVIKFGFLEEAGRKALDTLVSMGDQMKGLAEKTVSIAGDYQQNMLQLQFLTSQVGDSAQATADRMGEFNKAAIEVGKSTSFSSKEAMGAMAELAQMGYKTAEVTALIGTAANAAMINNIGLSQATNVLTSVMHGFGFQATDSARILDEMSRASQMGKISFADFGAEAENVGLIARAAGQSFEGVTAEMLALTNTGMSAARASETIRYALTQIEKPTAAAQKELKALGLSYYDSNGHMKSFTEIAKEVQAKTAGMTEEQRNLTIATLFGKNGILAYNAAVNAQATVMINGQQVTLHGTDALKYWEDQLKNSNGTVQKATDILKTGFNFQMKNLKGSIDEAMISVGNTLLPGLTSIIKHITELVNKFIDWEQKTHTVGKTILALGTDIEKGLISTFKTLKPVLEQIWKALDSVTDSLLKMYKAVNPLGIALNFAMLILNSLVANIKGVIIPAFEKMAVFLEANLLPLFNRLAAFVAKTIIPVLASLAAFAMNVLVPALVRAADILGLMFGPALTLIGKIITTELLPTLTRLWDTFDAKYMPTLRLLAQHFGQHLANSIQLADTKFKAALPAIEKFLKTIEPIALAVFKVVTAFNPLSIALTAFQGYLTGGVNGALDALKTKFERVGEYVEKALDVVLEAVKKFGPLILDWIVKEAPVIADKVLSWGEGIISWVLPYVPILLNALLNLGTQLLGWIEAYAPVIANQMLSWASMLVNWVLRAMPGLLNALGRIGTEILHWIEREAPILTRAFLKWTEIIVGWVIAAVPGVIRALEQVIYIILDWVGRSAPAILNAGLNLVDQLLTAFGTLLPKILQTLGIVARTFLNWISNNGPRILVELLGWTEQILVWVGTLIPPFLTALGKLITTLAGWFVANGPQILKMLLGWGLLIGEWALGLFISITPQLGVFISSMLNYFKEQGPALLNGLWGWIKVGADNIGKLFNDLLPSLIGIFEMLGTWVKNNAFNILDKFWSFLKSGLDALTMIMAKLGPLLADIMGAIGDWVRTNAGGMLDKFFSFLKTGLDTVTLLMGKLGAIFESLIDPIGVWFKNNTPKLLDKFWSFLESSLTTLETIMKKLGKLLEDLVDEIGKWVVKNETKMLDAFWSFLKTGIDTIDLIMKKLSPILVDLVKGLGKWVGENTPDMLNHFWSFLKTGVDTMTEIMKVLGPTLGELVLELGKWIKNNANDLLSHFWAFLKSTVEGIEIVMRFLGEALGDIFVAVGKWFVANHDDVLNTFWGFLKATGDDIDKLVKKIQPALQGIVSGIVNWFTDPKTGKGKEIFNAFWTWTQDLTYFTGKTMFQIMPSIVQFTDLVTHEFYTGAKKFIDAMEDGIANWIKTADGKQWTELGKALGGFILSGLKSSPFWAIITNLGGFIENNWNNPTGGGGIPKVPGKASGGMVEHSGVYDVGELGKERVFLPQGAYVMNAMHTRQADSVHSISNSNRVFNNNNNSSAEHHDHYDLHLNTQQAEPTVVQSFAVMQAMRRRP